MWNWLQDHLGRLVGGSTALSLLTFIGNLAIALSDGKLDGTEIHRFMSGANLLQMIILMGVIFVLKIKDNK